MAGRRVAWPWRGLFDVSKTRRMSVLFGVVLLPVSLVLLTAPSLRPWPKIGSLHGTASLKKSAKVAWLWSIARGMRR